MKKFAMTGDSGEPIRNVGQLQFDAGEIPKRTYSILLQHNLHVPWPVDLEGLFNRSAVNEITEPKWGVMKCLITTFWVGNKKDITLGRVQISLEFTLYIRK
jgi:hypothetical protein